MLERTLSKTRTWQIEALIVASVLLTVVGASGGGWVEYVGAVAVLAGFMHCQVSDRLYEAHQQQTVHSVKCARWMWRYWVAKEVAWVAYFVAHQSYSALAGVVIFAIYPLWRKLYRRAMQLGR